VDSALWQIFEAILRTLKQSGINPIVNEFEEAPSPGVNPALWQIFVELLRTFKQNGVNLIVNEFEEAPHAYDSSESREVSRRFMREIIEKRVREEGSAYVRVDFNKLHDDDYFDWNHLNSKGAGTFIPMLANELRPYLARN
jgi:anti-anti-sigma regulatory factor